MSTENGNDNDEKLFFTRSDLISHLNSSLVDIDKKTDANHLDKIDKPKFELQKRLPDGSSISADKADIAAANFQDKLKQAAAEVAKLSNKEKLEWAKEQRRHGNSFFAKGKYEEAMDIYMTCLVAMDPACFKEANENKQFKCTDKSSPKLINKNVDLSSTKEHEVSKQSDDVDKMQREVHLPVLLNLSLCTLKLGMLKKTERFCDYALEAPCARENAKVYFRRGRARMLMGLYEGSKSDLKTSLALILKQEKEITLSSSSEIRTEIVNTSREKDSVMKEISKLNRLINSAKVNSNRQKNAMQKILGGKQKEKKSNSELQTSESNIKKETYNRPELIQTSLPRLGDKRNQSTKNTNHDASIYDEVQPRRSHSNLTSESTSNITYGDNLEGHMKSNQSQSNFVKNHPLLAICLSCLERCLRRTLYFLGDEDAIHRSYDKDLLEDKLK